MCQHLEMGTVQEAAEDWTSACKLVALAAQPVVRGKLRVDAREGERQGGSVSLLINSLGPKALCQS
jgi:hypothetical protein